MSRVPLEAGQLPLNIGLRDSSTLENFFPLAAVKSALQGVGEQIAGEGEQCLYLYGPQDSGKSHLLQAACHALTAKSAYLPLEELRDYSPADVLASLDALELVCIDDLQAVVGDKDWESALFHLFNRARESACGLLFAADQSPRQLAFALEDLRSRLSWGLVFQLDSASDQELVQLLIFRAQRRGLTMSSEVANYLITRAPRSMTALLALLDELDRASLREQRALSVPFVKKILNL